jgi:hypothetical protein
VQKGFIFFVTICIIAVMSLLILASMQHVLLYQRASNKQEEGHQRFYELEHIARHLIDAPIDTLQACRVKQNLANKALQQVKDKHRCSLTVKKNKYRYLIEDLGEYSCLVGLHKGVKKSTHHYRFTLLSQLDNNHPSLLVQIRVIRLARSFSCAKNIRYVAVGTSSWRYIEDIESISNQDT